MRRSTTGLAAIAFAAVLALTGAACGGGDGSGSGGEEEGSGTAAGDGEVLYRRHCSLCHGEDLKGTRTGPPFLHRVYEPNHHPDESFRSAVRNGVAAHHWDFGAMPRQPAVGDDEIDAIIDYIRAEQRAAGIF